MADRQAPVWVGEEEMSAALNSLCKQRPVAASKVKVAAKTALKYTNDYKMAVHSIEGFIRKAAPVDKLCGIYVLDAICRQPKSQMFRERFSIRLKETVLLVNENVSAQDKPSFIRLVEEWDRKSLFENCNEKFATLVASSGGGGGGSATQIYKSSTHIVPSSSSSSITSPAITQPAVVPVAVSAATAVAVSATPTATAVTSASIIDPRKRKHEATSSSSSSSTVSGPGSGPGSGSGSSSLPGTTAGTGSGLGESTILLKSGDGVISSSAYNFFIHDLPPAGGRAALYVKMCPFADNCVFGDRCRCSHSDVLGFQPSYSFAPRKNKNASFLSPPILRPEERIPLSALTAKLIVPLSLQ